MSQNQAISRSYFDGSTLQLFGYKLLGTLLTLLTFSLAYPWALCMIYRWQTKHTVIDGRRLKFTGNGMQLFGKHLLWSLLTVVTLGIFLIFRAVAIKKWIVKHTEFAD